MDHQHSPLRGPMLHTSVEEIREADRMSMYLISRGNVVMWSLVLIICRSVGLNLGPYLERITFT